MEVGAATSSSYLPSQFAEARQAKGLAREVSGARENTAKIGGERQESGNPRSLVASYPDDTKLSQATKPADAPEPNSLRNEVEYRSAEQARETQAPRHAASSQAGGSIKLDVEDGNRVMKVFDSKDVLIYQLPPKGALMLIKAQEQEQQSQVQTSA
jgi:hypothetical protein